MDRGRGPAQDLIYGSTHLADICPAQPLNLLRMLHQGAQASGNGATRCLGTGGKQQHEEVEQLIIGERSTRAVIFVRVKMGRDDRRQDIFGQVPALIGDQFGAIVAQSVRVLPGNDLRGRRGDASIDPLSKLGTVLLRHADQQTDRLQGQITGEAGDEVEWLIVGKGVNQGHRAPAQLSLQVMDGAVVNPLLTRLRTRLWRGSSDQFRNLPAWYSSCNPVPPAVRPPPLSEENVAGSSMMAMASSCRLITQNPSPSGVTAVGSCQYTGMLARPR